MIYLNSWQLIFIFFIMIFLHIVDDYYLQGCLANLKQRNWWKKQPEYNYNKYENDFIAALFCHAFSWSFMINLPWIILTKCDSVLVLVLIIINFIIHTIVDDLKANKKTINLQEDQIIHLIQIFLTWAIYIFVYYNY